MYKGRRPEAVDITPVGPGAFRLERWSSTRRNSCPLECRAMLLHTHGMDLFYEVEGAGEPLLWLHGGMGLGRDWQYIFTGPPAGYRLIAPDQRGHGKSAGARATYSFEQAARDSFALLDHLKLDRAKIIGLSGGGITALHMAALDPSRVAAMVVVSAPPRFPEQARTIQRAFSESTLSDQER